jgi:hypothetical protein
VKKHAATRQTRPRLELVMHIPYFAGLERKF